MSHARTYARSGVELVAVIVTVGCASADAGRRSPGPPREVEEARRAIVARIASTVETVKRGDVEGLIDGGGARRRGDGGEMSRDETRDTFAAELAPVERTTDLVVHLDSLRLTSDSSALVYTTQRWERVIVAADGSRHRATTHHWLLQEWSRRRGEWRGTGRVVETRPSAATMDGSPFVVVAP